MFERFFFHFYRDLISFSFAYSLTVIVDGKFEAKHWTPVAMIGESLAHRFANCEHNRLRLQQRIPIINSFCCNSLPMLLILLVMAGIHIHMHCVCVCVSCARKNYSLLVSDSRIPIWLDHRTLLFKRVIITIVLLLRRGKKKNKPWDHNKAFLCNTVGIFDSFVIPLFPTFPRMEA